MAYSLKVAAPWNHEMEGRGQPISVKGFEGGGGRACCAGGVAKAVKFVVELLMQTLDVRRHRTSMVV